AISHGLTSAIMNPLHAEVRTAVMAADVMMSHDPNCAAWIAEHRQPAEGAGTGAGAGGGRRRGRRARTGQAGPTA
ncbi:MAG: hypothetical protein GY773_11865, partial [Actinomycetia bacterium]|nr:hypothetical protein [Actinomycetes bacterium]